MDHTVRDQRGVLVVPHCSVCGKLGSDEMASLRQARCDWRRAGSVPLGDPGEQTNHCHKQGDLDLAMALGQAGDHYLANPRVLQGGWSRGAWSRMDSCPRTTGAHGVHSALPAA